MPIPGCSRGAPASRHTGDANNVDASDYATFNLGGSITSENIVTNDGSTENKFEAVAARLYDTMFDSDTASFEVQASAKFIQIDNLNQLLLADECMTSLEFRGKYGATSNAQYAEHIYQNALGRAASVADRLGTMTALDDGPFNRAYLSVGLSESTGQVVADNVHAITNNT